MKPLCESLTYLIYTFIKMTRSLKTFMRNRKAEMLWCGPCECRTLQCWRQANENCWCGENDTIHETGIYVMATAENEADIYIFIDTLELHAQTSVSVETDTENPQVIAWDASYFDDSKYDNEYFLSKLREVWEAQDAECVEKIIWQSVEEETPIKIPDVEKLNTQRQINKYFEKIDDILSEACSD